MTLKSDILKFKKIMGKFNENEIEKFEIYAQSKIAECKELYETQPMTAELAFNIYTVALHLNDINHSTVWDYDPEVDEEEVEEMVVDFYNAALSLEKSVKKFENIIF